MNQALQALDDRETLLTPDVMRQLERYAYLRAIDDKWKDHLRELDHLRSSIGLRAYGQKDPLLEYKSEAFVMFEEMLKEIDKQTLYFIFHAQVSVRPPEVERARLESADADSQRRERRTPAPRRCRPAPAGAARRRRRRRRAGRRRRRRRYRALRPGASRPNRRGPRPCATPGPRSAATIRARAAAARSTSSATAQRSNGDARRRAVARRAGAAFRGGSPAPQARSAKSGAESLVIVESPAKAKTIKKYLGRGLRREGLDRPRHRPAQERAGRRRRERLRAQVRHHQGQDQGPQGTARHAGKAVDQVLLATDLDREGEAIAWHLQNELRDGAAQHPAHHLQRDHQARHPRGRRRARATSTRTRSTRSRRGAFSTGSWATW